MTAIQVSCRKDIERSFGVLQGRFRILRHEMHECSDEVVTDILHVYVVIHNMIAKLCKPSNGYDERNEAREIASSDELVFEFIHFGEQDNLPSNSYVHFLISPIG